MAGRNEYGNQHTDACNSTACPCFVDGLRDGNHDPTGADHLAEMMVLAEQRDAVLDILDEFHAMSMSEDSLAMSQRIRDALGGEG